MTVVWITGLPSSGKSTLARTLFERLIADRRALLLDGDDVRTALGMHAYDPAGRDSFYRALAGLAGLVARQGTIAIVAATSPSRAHRAVAREAAPHFVEVYVDTPLDECTRRDTKGLYAAERRGELGDVPGGSVAYEPPRQPDVIAHGGHDDAAIAAILERVTRSPMPYAKNADLPAPVRRVLPRHAQDIYRAAFNDAHARYREAVAHRIAWAAVKRRYAHLASGVWAPRKHRA